MRWNEFLDTANRLVRGSTEGDWRSAVSRGYYGVFHFFREFLLTNGVDIGQGGASHSNLYIGLNNCGTSAMTRIADWVNDLRRARTRADYDLRCYVDQQESFAAANDSAALVADFQAILTAVLAAQIAAGAKRYLKSIGRIP